MGLINLRSGCATRFIPRDIERQLQTMHFGLCNDLEWTEGGRVVFRPSHTIPNLTSEGMKCMVGSGDTRTNLESV